MATLTADQLRVVRSWVGDKPTDDDLNERYNRLGTLTGTVEESLRHQLAVLREQPSQISLPSGLSVQTTQNITALQTALEKLVAAGSLDDDDTATTGVYRMVRNQYR